MTGLYRDRNTPHQPGQCASRFPFFWLFVILVLLSPSDSDSIPAEPGPCDGGLTTPDCADDVACFEPPLAGGTPDEFIVERLTETGWVITARLPFTPAAEYYTIPIGCSAFDESVAYRVRAVNSAGSSDGRIVAWDPCAQWDLDVESLALACGQGDCRECVTGEPCASVPEAWCCLEWVTDPECVPNICPVPIGGRGIWPAEPCAATRGAAGGGNP